MKGQRSVGLNGLAITTLTYDKMGSFEFACHPPITTSPRCAAWLK